MRSGDNDDEKELFKAAIKEAAREWLDEQFRAFGKWTAMGLAAAVFYGALKVAVAMKLWP